MAGSTRQARESLGSMRASYTDIPKAQLRPSTGMYDQKESLWLQSRSEWPSDQDVPGFRETTTNFMGKCAAISNQLRT